MFTPYNVNVTESETLLDSNSADYVEKVSRYFEFSAQQRHDDVDSDSGSSLFITQNPVPEATRSRKRHRQRLHRTSANYQEGRDDDDDDDDDSISAKQTKGRKCKIHQLPKHHFPFLAGMGGIQLPLRRRNLANLTQQQNTRLHYYSMGGFFKCVQELQRSQKTSGNPESSLPTIDGDCEEIAPLSEEEEWADDEDIRVVDNRQFVVKPKTSQRNTAKTSNQEAKRQVRTDPQQKRWRNVKKTRITPSSGLSGGKIWDRVSAAAVDSCHSVTDQTEEASDWVKEYQRIVSDESEKQTEKTQERANGTRSREDQGSCNNNETIFSTADLQRRAEDDASSIRTELDKDSLSPTGRTKDKSPNSQNPLSDLISQLHRLSDEAVVEEKKKGLCEDDGWTVDVTEEITAASPVLQTDDELQVNENSSVKEPSPDNVLRQEEASTGDGVSQRDVPHLKVKKKKHKNQVEDVILEEGDGDLDPVTRAEEDSVVKKKNKKKKKREDVDVEQLLPSKDSEYINDDSAIITKKNKKKSKRLVEDRDDATQTLTLEPPEMLERFEEAERSLQNAAKRCKKKQLSSPKDDNQIGEVGEDECGEATQSVKKKKKIKRRVSMVIVETDESKNTEEFQETPEATSKTKKMRQISDKNTSEDSFTRNRKKKKKSIGSFGVDASSTSDGDFEVPSASESVQRDHTVVFEKQNQTGESDFPKAKRKKKKQRDERGSERSGSVSDLELGPNKEAAVFKKIRTKSKETQQDAAHGLAKLPPSPRDGIREKSENVVNLSETDVAGEAGDATTSSTLHRHPEKNSKIKPRPTKNRTSPVELSSLVLHKSPSSVSSDTIKCKKAKRKLFSFYQNYLSN